MWIFIVLFSAVSTVALGDINCSEHPLDSCPYPELFRQIPATVTEYNELCRGPENFIKCLGQYEKTCGTENFHSVFQSQDHYENLQTVFAELCDEGTMLNDVITENLRCLNNTISSRTCSRDCSLHTFYSSEDITMLDGDTFALRLKITCLCGLYDIACITAELSENCGALVKEIAYDLIRQTYFVEYVCSERHIKELFEDAKLYSMIKIYDDFLYNVMGKYVDDSELGSGYF
ncbi:uncharacterized protein CDAR_68241 [Caerostris darwini]|uniref:Uncharacterized protein n=1 Tax=Caerostris darwini TaxID=1538125 RepID=A0AAV4MYS8_9ARAC|nr:uncharacterized protein CDAR_68241 [Caerostris darwini]